MLYDCLHKKYIHKTVNLQCTPSGMTWSWGTVVPFSPTCQDISVTEHVIPLKAFGELKA